MVGATFHRDAIVSPRHLRSNRARGGPYHFPLSASWRIVLSRLDDEQVHRRADRDGAAPGGSRHPGRRDLPQAWRQRAELLSLGKALRRRGGERAPGAAPAPGGESQLKGAGGGPVFHPPVLPYPRPPGVVGPQPSLKPRAPVDSFLGRTAQVGGTSDLLGDRGNCRPLLMRARSRAPGPSAPHGPAPRGKPCSVWR